ncbi:Hypothetical predicted protein [Paramuricea clavata]|uniref:Uncharacterized protein n=1 Tax=Paramuricea clavata TaxID=317549 RepID=A0A7D9DJL9_PARCT|nr:Hypothetical predicted protein [Paramuricea clavata]
MAESTCGFDSKLCTEYAELFKRNRIQESFLPNLNYQLLRGMGIDIVGDIIAILKTIAESDDVYESDNNIRTISKIYGRNKNQSITEYQKAVNDSSFVLAKENPALLADRKELMSKAQAKVRETSGFTSLTSVTKDQNKEVPSPIIVDASCEVANDKNVTSAQPFINCASLHVDNDASSTTSVPAEILKNSHNLSVNVGSSIECGNSSNSGQSSYCADQNFF